jgi:hypothetical protein
VGDERDTVPANAIEAITIENPVKAIAFRTSWGNRCNIITPSDWGIWFATDFELVPFYFCGWHMQAIGASTHPTSAETPRDGDFIPECD